MAEPQRQTERSPWTPEQVAEAIVIADYFDRRLSELEEGAGAEAAKIIASGRQRIRWHRQSLHRQQHTHPTAAPARTAPRRRGAGRPRAASSRSSARSGDSGLDDPEPAPEAARAAVADAWVALLRRRHGPAVDWTVAS
jgi:hypothetical protein